MEDLVKKLPQPYKKVVDHISHTSVTAEACLELPQLRRFVGCDVHVDYFAKRTEAPVKTHRGQVLNEKSYVSGSHAVVNMGKMFFRALKGLLEWKWITSCKVPAGFCLEPTFSSQTCTFCEYLPGSVFLRERVPDYTSTVIVYLAGKV